MCQWVTATPPPTLNEAVDPPLPEASWKVGWHPEHSVFLHGLLFLQHPPLTSAILAITVPSVCRDRKWNCTEHVCDATCSMLGMAHYITFDGLKYMFPGECQYVLAQVSGRENGAVCP